MAATPSDRTELLLALILVSLNKNEPMRRQALLLSSAGFSNIEIADLLGTSGSNVAQALYEVRRDGKKKNKKSR
jgi:DNA-directed RNA polymerase specialized sigma24 family protein